MVADGNLARRSADRLMKIGALTIELAVYESLSLKDKRSAITSLISRLKNRFNVSVAEVGHLDSRQLATIAVVMVANDSKYVHGCLDKIVDFVRKNPSATLVDYSKEMV